MSILLTAALSSLPTGGPEPGPSYALRNDQTGEYVTGYEHRYYSPFMSLDWREAKTFPTASQARSYKTALRVVYWTRTRVVKVDGKGGYESRNSDFDWKD